MVRKKERVRKISPRMESRMKAIQEMLMTQYPAGVEMPSNIAGNEREIFVREFLSKIFPPHYYIPMCRFLSS